jgi:hypothetical protein
VRRMLIAVATGALGMMVLARVATVLTLAPAGLPEPWELGEPPAVVAPGPPAGVPAAPVPAVGAVETTLPPPPSTATAVGHPGVAPSPRATADAPRAASGPVAASGSERQAAPSPPPASSSGTGDAAARSAPSDPSQSSGGSPGAPPAKVCLKLVAGVCVQLG